MSKSRRKKKARTRRYEAPIELTTDHRNPENDIPFDLRIWHIRPRVSEFTLCVYIYVLASDVPGERLWPSFEAFIDMLMHEEKPPRDPSSIHKAFDLLVTHKLITPEQQERHMPRTYRNLAVSA